jgi:hypothetical protein
MEIKRQFVFDMQKYYDLCMKTTHKVRVLTYDSSKIVDRQTLEASKKTEATKGTKKV